ncbi:MAG: hydantoinase/oxoprolinase N-terminal domain-containing protein [Myxococcota bacterium]
MFVHGTTLATNAIIERKGARTALIATDGPRVPGARVATAWSATGSDAAPSAIIPPRFAAIRGRRTSSAHSTTRAAANAQPTSSTSANATPDASASWIHPTNGSRWPDSRATWSSADTVIHVDAIVVSTRTALTTAARNATRRGRRSRTSGMASHRPTTRSPGYPGGFGGRVGRRMRPGAVSG